MYLVLSRTNRAIEQAQDGPALLKGACEVIVQVGGFIMSWVGVVDRKDLVVTPAGCAGHNDGYLDLLGIRLEGERSGGPTGQAIRQRHTVVCEDISTDPRMRPWREEALKRGYRSSIGLPLRVTMRVLPMFTMRALISSFHPAQAEPLALRWLASTGAAVRGAAGTSRRTSGA